MICCKSNNLYLELLLQFQKSNRNIIFQFQVSKVSIFFFYLCLNGKYKKKISSSKGIQTTTNTLKQLIIQPILPPTNISLIFKEQQIQNATKELLTQGQMENIRKITGSKSLKVLKVLLTPHISNLIALFLKIISFSPTFLSFLSSLSFLTFWCLFWNEIGIFTLHIHPRPHLPHLLLVWLHCNSFRVPFLAFQSVSKQIKNYQQIKVFILHIFENFFYMLVNRMSQFIQLSLDLGLFLKNCCQKQFGIYPLFHFVQTLGSHFQYLQQSLSFFHHLGMNALIHFYFIYYSKLSYRQIQTDKVHQNTFVNNLNFRKYLLSLLYPSIYFYSCLINQDFIFINMFLKYRQRQFRSTQIQLIRKQTLLKHFDEFKYSFQFMCFHKN